METNKSVAAINIPAMVWWLTAAVLFAVLLLPLLTTEIPPLLDYPNHLARVEVIAHHASDPALARMYGVEWRIVPNMGLTVVMPMLRQFLSLEATGKIILAATLLLPLAGVVALHRALFRVRSYWPLAAGLVVYNRLFFLAFMDYLTGVGFALLGAAAWEAMKDLAVVPRLLVASLFATVIFFCHLIALVFFGLLLVGLELARAIKERRLNPGRIQLVIVPFLIPAILYLRAPVGPAHPDGGHGLINILKQYYWAMLGGPRGLKLYGLMESFMTYNRWLDGIAMAVVFALLIVLYKRGRLVVAPAAAGLFLALLLAYPFIPFSVLGAVFIDQRIPILLGFLLFACTLPVVTSRNTSRFIFAAIALVMVVRTAEIGQVWLGRDAQLADFRKAIARVQPGDRVLVVQAQPNDDPNGWLSNPDSVPSMIYNDATLHLPALLVIERKAFWPLMFTSARHTVTVMPPYDTISYTETTPPWAGILAAPQSRPHGWAPYLADWENHFDWVLLLLPSWMPDGYKLLPDRLDPVVANDVAALYRIKKGKSDDSSPIN